MLDIKFYTFFIMKISNKRELQHSLEEANEDQEKSLNEIIYFNRKTKPKNEIKKQEKEDVIKNLRNFYNSRKKSLMLLIVKYFL